MKKIFELNYLKLVSKYKKELMGIATIWIFLLHKWERIFGNIRIIGPLEWYTVNYGACGVDIFMFLSGIGLVFSIVKAKTIKEFYYRRIKRIFVPYIIEAIMFFGFTKKLLYDIIGYNFWFISIWKSYGWFYHSILFLYLIFPFYFNLFKNIKHKVLFTIIMIILCFSLNFFGGNLIREDLFCLINRIPFFLVGIAIGYYSKENKSLNYNAKTLFLIILILLFFEKIDLGLCYYETKYVLLSICIIYLFPLLLELFNLKYFNSALSFIGLFSYEMYLVQMNINPARFYDYYPTLLANILLFLVTLFVSFLFNKLNKYFWITVEKIFKIDTN